MQQVAVLNYELSCIDVYTVDDDVGIEEYLEEKLDTSLDEIYWLSCKGVLPITIHKND